MSAPDNRQVAASGASDTAASFIVFAAILLIMVGAFQAFQALVALFNDTFYVVGAKYIFQLNLTTWGWVHLLIGALLILTGLFLLRGAAWARWTGVVLAGLSALANFLWLPHYPVWSVLVIAVDIMIIWALAAHGRQFERALH
ncbi:MAG: DUF7144 family membrane protein [Dermatophilaceae bacterium]